jgi:hypothetical protein
MKKTLLFFLILLPSLFYAQVSSIIHCAGNNTFDLTSRNEEMTRDLTPGQTITFKYYIKDTYATNDEYAVEDPQNFVTNERTLKIYVRINTSGGTTIMNSFSLILNSDLNIAYSTIKYPGCTNPSITIGATGGRPPYQYSLDGVNYQSTNVIYNVSPGSYTLYVKDDYGCTTTSTKVIDPVYALTATSMISNQNVIITATGGTASYQYSSDGVNYQTNNFFPNLTPGNYVFSVKDSNGCLATVPFTVFPVLNATVVITKEIDCSSNSNASIAVLGAGGQLPYTYSLNGGSFQLNSTFNNLTTGTYFIVVKDAVNTISNPVSIVIDPLSPLAVSTVIKPIDCSSNAIITVTANGGRAPYTYSFEGGTFTTTNTFSTGAPGTYVVNVKGNNGCVSPATFVVVQPFTALNLTAANTPILCAGEFSSLTINVSGGQTPYLYSLNNSAYTSNSIYTQQKAGTYNIKVKDAAECITESEYTITEPTYMDGGNLLVEGQTVTVIDVHGGSGSYLYSLDSKGFQTSNIFTNVKGKNHNIFIKDSAGCYGFGLSFDIDDPTLLTSSITITEPLDCDNNATVEIIANGGQAPYTYSIDGGTMYETNNTFNNLIAGTYTVNIKDAAGNTNINNVLISPYSPLEISYTLINPNCFGSNDVSINMTATGGITPYAYSLNNSAFTTSNNFNGLQAGNYMLTVKDFVGCISTMIVTIVEPTILSITASTTNLTTIANNDGIITVNATGGMAPYSYSLLNSSNAIIIPEQLSNTFNNLASGTYDVIVKDAKGCSSFLTQVTISAPSMLTAVAAVNQTTCQDPTGTITVIASKGVVPYRYSLDGVNYVSSNTFSGLAPGIYTISVKDNQNTITSIIASISPFNPLVAAAVLIKDMDCLSNASINVITSGGSGVYQYSMNNGPFQASNLFTNLTSGSYRFTIKDSNDCSIFTNDIILEQPIPLTATVTNTHVIDCYADAYSNVVITAKGGKTPYQYSLNKLPYDSNRNVMELYPGKYIIDVKDANACIFSTQFTVESPSALSATAFVNKSTECGVKDSATITGIGGQPPYTYSFDEAVTYSESNTNLVSGVQTFFVKDSNGCQASVYIAVEQSLLSAATTTDVYNKTIKVNATGGKAPYKYTLKKNSEIIIGSQNENVFNNVAFGSYVVEVTDANGCVVSSNSELYSPLIISTVITNPADSESYGTITVNATGGKAPYQYSINGNAFVSNNLFTNLVQGVYIINVRDSSNNISSLYVVIAPQNPLIAAMVKTNVNCYGSNNGTIVVNATGGIMPYTYSLYNNETPIILNSNSNSFTNLPAGDYKVRVTDATGYYYLSNNIFVLEPSPLVAILTVENQTVTINTSGGSGEIQSAISPNLDKFSTENVFYDLAPGNYMLIVKDANGCSLISSVVIDIPAPLINNKSTTTIEFTPGQTLGDLIVEGQNIKWYSTATNASKKTNKSAEATLPLTTLLVDGNTYYASQTINGIESTKRLAVTAKLSGSLSIPDFALPNFTYYPNPVQHTLSISNTSNIDEIEIFSVSGKTVLTKKINSDHSEIDLSNISTGFYFLKVKAEGQTKTIKIVKK